MSNNSRQFELHILADRLWSENGPGARSSELTPTYVERFSGPLTARGTTTHAYWEWIYVLGGQGELKGDIPTPLTAGDGCLIPPGAAHIEVAPDTIDLVWVGLQGAMFEGDAIGDDQCARKAFTNAPSSRTVTASATHEITNGDTCQHANTPMLRNSVLELWNLTRRPGGSIGMEIDGITRQIIGRFLRTSGGENDPESSRFEDIIEYLNKAYASDLAMPEVAARFSMSEGHFYREFHRHCGMTPVSYLTQIRIRHAVRWLRDTEQPIAKIASLTGFRDTHYFSRVVRRITGQTPSAIRGHGTPY